MKKTENTEEKICGQPVSAIRKAFFKGKVGVLLTEIQASGEYQQEDYDKLKLFLAALQKKDEQLNSGFAEFLPKIETEAPDSVLDELNQESLSEAEISELGKEKSNREAAIVFASKMIKNIFIQFRDPKKKAPNEEELISMAFEFLSLEYYILRQKIYLERLYRKKIVEFERMGKQRKLAEEFARMSVEYRDFAIIEGLLEQVKEFILLAKKRYRDI